jgi:tRNA pseudouridine55 synthase
MGSRRRWRDSGGTYEQRPPAYSAVKVAGERAYRRARRGETVVLAARRVEVTELALAELALPDVRFRATVSGGTYLRSVARDLGEALGCGAHLAALTRTGVGPFLLDGAVDPAVITPRDLRDPALLVAELPRRDLDPTERTQVLHGRPVPAGGGRREAGAVALFADGSLVAVAEQVEDVLKPRVVVADA